MRLPVLLAAFLACMAGIAEAKHLQLTPWRDALFAYPPVIENGLGGAYMRVAYDKQRDIYERDQIPRRKAKQEYVNERVSWSRSRSSYKSGGKTLKMFSVAKGRRAPAITVIYLYGRGGNRRQGVNDWTFGGNFNRLQNLMVQNGGRLLTPDFSGFGSDGARNIADLIAQVRRASPRTFLVIACGSMGGGVCWQLAENPATAAEIDGMFLLGSPPSKSFLQSDLMKNPNQRFPLFFGHGSSDIVYGGAQQFAFFRQILERAPGYPARFVMFDNGVHGTPIRMVDWRRELNWMLSIH